MKEKNDTTTITKQIEQGYFKDYYLIYNRKSTDEPENQKNSLTYQLAENKRFAQKEKLLIATVSIGGFCANGVINEKHSAFKESEVMTISNDGLVQFKIERPKFHKLVQLLNQKLFKGVIFLCWDRASRNDADEAILKKLLKSRVDLRFTLTTYDKSSSGALHMDIDGMFAQHHSRVTSEKVRLNIYNQKEKGIVTSAAPVGYLNTGTMLHKPLDPKRAPIIKQMFELYATGDWTISRIVAWAIAQGFTMPPKRRKKTVAERLAEEESDTIIEIEKVEHLPTEQRISSIFSNRFYLGKIRGNDGVWIKSNSHEALVTETLFNQVQQVAARKNVSKKYSIALELPFRGFIKCGACNRVYTPYVQKGIVYFKVNCLQHCTNSVKHINEVYIENAISELLQKIVLSNEEIETLKTHLETQKNICEDNKTKEEESYKRAKAKLVEDLEYLTNNKLNLLKTMVYTPEAYMSELDNLEKQLNILEQQYTQTSADLIQIIQDVIQLSELLKDLCFYMYAANLSEKDSISRIVFSELFICQNNLTYQCKNGFAFLEKRLILSGALNVTDSDFPYIHHSIKEGIVALQNIITFKN